MKMHTSEKRSHHRREFLCDVTCEIFKHGKASGHIDSRTINISTTGICVESESTPEPGTVLYLSPKPQYAGASVQAHGPAMVIWTAPAWETLAKGRFRIGIRFLG